MHTNPTVVLGFAYGHGFYFMWSQTEIQTVNINIFSVYITLKAEVVFF